MSNVIDKKQWFTDAEDYLQSNFCVVLADIGYHYEEFYSAYAEDGKKTPQNAVEALAAYYDLPRVIG